MLTDQYSKQLALYSNLIIVAKKHNNHSEVIKIAAIVEKELFPHITDNTNDKKVKDKIIFNIVSFIISKRNTLGNNNKFSKVNVSDVMDRAERLLSQFTDQTSEYFKSITTQFNEFRQTLNITHQPSIAPPRILY